MFEGKRYITTGINDSIEIDLQLYMWQLIDDLKVKKNFKIDYLQVFELHAVMIDDIVVEILEHRQELEPYKKEYKILLVGPVNAKIFVIDDYEQSVMMLSEEY